MGDIYLCNICEKRETCTKGWAICLECLSESYESLAEYKEQEREDND